ncbi:uncharacterized protein [Choristoneura fumiferana]|uniref:uncharacterized protein n=1 Tax=Choristoneura fumiferana TaxID=7141 RepID=UPI003D159FCD
MGGKRRYKGRDDDGYEEIMRKLRKLEKEVKRKRSISISGSDDGEMDYQLYDDISMDEFDNEIGTQDGPSPAASSAPGPAAPLAPAAPPAPPRPPRRPRTPMC